MGEDWPQVGAWPLLHGNRRGGEADGSQFREGTGHHCSLWSTEWTYPLHSFNHIYKDRLGGCCFLFFAFQAAAKSCQRHCWKVQPWRVPAFLAGLFLSRPDIVNHALRSIFSFLFGSCLFHQSLPPHDKLWLCFAPSVPEFRHRLVG